MTIVSKASAFPKSVQAGIPRLGRCPEGWTREPLARHLVENLRPVKLSNDAEYDLVTVKRSRGGVVRREHLKGRDISVKSQFLLNEGDFLISKRQIVHGACGVVPAELAGSIVSNEYAILGAKPTIDLNFLNHLAHSVYFQQTCFHSSIGVHVEKMIFKLDRWLAWDFDLPPLPEQQRIAEILSSWDCAIRTVEALIANARDQKHALMQSLVTGQERLPGFTGEWTKSTVSQITNVLISNIDKKSAAAEQTVRLCNYMDVYRSDQIEADMDFMIATATADQVRKFGLRVGDVLITKDSETPDDIAVPAHVASTAPDLVCGYHLAILRPKRGCDGQFLKFYFEHPHTRYFFATRANGATRFGLTIDAIEAAPITLPGYEEQQRIAAVIAVAEQEIDRLKPIAAALREEKSALMQQLLTGKRRVKVDLERETC